MEPFSSHAGRRPCAFVLWPHQPTVVRPSQHNDAGRQWGCWIFSHQITVFVAQESTSAMCRENDGGVCGTAKFREETSKKSRQRARGRVAAVHNLGRRSVVNKETFHTAAYTKALDNKGEVGVQGRPLTPF
jgi:hypothetical protein